MFSTAWDISVRTKPLLVHVENNRPIPRSASRHWLTSVFTHDMCICWSYDSRAGRSYPNPTTIMQTYIIFNKKKKKERRKNTGILVWKRQATSQCVKTEYSPKWICCIITSELALVSDGTSVGARPVGWEWRPLEARVYYCLCTNNISEPRDPAGIVLVCMTTLL